MCQDEAEYLCPLQPPGARISLKRTMSTRSVISMMTIEGTDGALSKEWKGYVFQISGENSKQDILYEEMCLGA